MKVTFLGTGTSQGVPVIGCDCEVCRSNSTKDKRLRSSVLVEIDDLNIVIDTGPDFRQQMLRHEVNSLSAVVFTHEHKDHIAGLDDVRAYNYLSKKPMDIYASDEVQGALKRDFYYAFEETRYPGVPSLNLHTIEDSPFFIGDLEITPIKVWHLRMPVMGFRIGDFTYITDANRIDDDEKEKIKGSEVLVLNALRKSKHISHLNLSEAIELGLELDIPRVFFTHISHLMGIHDSVSTELPTNMELAYDGLIVEI